MGALPLNVNDRTPNRPGSPANDNPYSRRVVVHLVPSAPITITELEVFDYLIGSFSGFAANDNERPMPNPDVVHDPPAHEKFRVSAWAPDTMAA